MSKELSPNPPGQIAFKPYEVGSIVPQLREQKQRDEAAAARYIQSVNESMDAQYKDGKRTEQAIQNWSNDMKSLTQFSQTLLNEFTEYQKQQNQQEMEEGIAEAYMGGVSIEEQSQLEDIEGLINEEDKVTQPAGQAAYDQTGDFQVASRVRGMSGWRAYGYQVGRAQMAGTEYSAYLNQGMETDNTTEINVNGKIITPATASSPAEVQAAMATLRGQFIRKYGLGGMNKALLNKYAFPQMHRTDSTLASRYHNRFAGEESDRIIQDAKTTFQADKDIGAFINRVKGLINPKTKRPYTNGEAHDQVFKYIEDSIRAGTLTPQELRAIGEQVVPWDPKGRKFNELYETRIEGAIRNADAFVREEARIERQELEIESKETEKAIFDDIFQNPGKYTKDEIEQVHRQFMSRYGRQSAMLSQAAQNLSLDSEQIKEQRTMLENLRRNGALRTEHVLKSHPSLYNEFFNQAQAQEQANDAETGVHKEAHKALTTEIKKARKLLEGNKDLDVVGTMILADLYSRYTTEFSALIAQSIDPATASRTAMANALQYYQKEGGGLGNSANPDGKYYKENILKGVAGTGNDALKSLQEVEQTIENLGSKAWSAPNLILKEAELLKMEQDYLQPGWEIPEKVKYFSSKYGIDPYKLINMQRAAIGLQPLQSPAGQLKESLTPRSNSLLDHFPSRRRTTRAMSMSGVGYRPESVPYSEQITIASQQSGVPEPYVAAMMMIESAGDAGAVSPTGAKGLMQIMPGWHPGYEGSFFDPQSNLNYGAQFMQQLFEKYGNWDDAVQAYNAGPGNWDQYLVDGKVTPLIRDAKHHLRKWKMQLSAWDNTVLSDPSTQRFEVVQTVSTDPRYQGDNDPSTVYDPDEHGGDNMHQHYEFATREQAALAKKLYESKGFRVTSYIRRGDTGAHGSGYAIDVAPPLDLPRNDQAEMEWIDQANAVIGLS